MTRTLLTLTEEQWQSLGGLPRRMAPHEALMEFWRLALGLSIEEWAALPVDTFNVMDYEVSAADDERLQALLNAQATTPMQRRSVAFVLLAIGPAVGA